MSGLSPMGANSIMMSCLFGELQQQLTSALKATEAATAAHREALQIASDQCAARKYWQDRALDARIELGHFRAACERALIAMQHAGYAADVLRAALRGDPIPALPTNGPDDLGPGAAHLQWWDGPAHGSVGSTNKHGPGDQPEAASAGDQPGAQETGTREGTVSGTVTAPTAGGKLPGAGR